MRILLSITTILAAGLATAAQADSRYRNLDANGVDLVSGGFLVNFPEGSIGSGDAELSLVHFINGGPLKSNWDNFSFLLTRVGTSGSTVKIVTPSR